ncbi:MAG: DsbA family protein [Candidatus Micrarchaeia archaeon]
MKRFLLLLPTILLLAGCLGGPASSEKSVEASVKDFLIRYYGVWDVAVTNTSFRNGLWFVNVSYSSERGRSSTLILIDDTNLSSRWELLPFITTPIGIAPIPGKLSCSEGGRLKVMLFTDPYCEACLRAEEPIAQLKAKFNESIDFEYRLLLTDTQLLAKNFGYENASLAASYFACAREQGNAVLDPVKECALAAYRNHAGTPLSKDELDACLPRATALDVASFDACLQTANQLLDFDNKLALTYLAPTPITPRVVIDCTVKATPRTAEYAICADFQKNQSIPGCPPPEKKAKKKSNASAQTET